jgi:hypothetical protein
MAEIKSRLQTLEEEFIETSNIITQLFCERDIAMALQDNVAMQECNDQLSSFKKRKDVISVLLERAKSTAEQKDFKEFVAALTITSFSQV